MPWLRKRKPTYEDIRQVLNPYKPPTTTDAVAERSGGSLSRSQAVLFGIFGCAFIAILIGELLAFIALMPPLNRWTHLDNEFAGLLLIAIPIFAGPCGALAGLTLGLLYPKWYCRVIAAGWAFLPALGSLTAESGIMIAATISAVLVTHRMLVSIEYRRSQQGSASTPPKSRIVSIAAMMAVMMMVASVATDVWLWHRIENQGLSGSEFPLVGAFVLALMSSTTSVYLGLTHPDRRTFAALMFTAVLVAFVGVLLLWYVQLIA